MGQNDDEWMWEQVGAQTELMDEGIIHEGELVDDRIQNLIYDRVDYNRAVKEAHKVHERALKEPEFDIDFWIDVAESSLNSLIASDNLITAVDQLNNAIGLRWERMIKRHCR